MVPESVNQPERATMTIYSIHIIQDEKPVYTGPPTPLDELEEEARNLPWDLVTGKAQVKYFNIDTNDYEPQPF